VALDSLTELDQFSTTGFPPGSLDSLRTFFSPVDNVHGALVALIKSAHQSLVVAMYGFDDQELADALAEKLNAEHVFVQFTLDSSQAHGVHERAILAAENYRHHAPQDGGDRRAGRGDRVHQLVRLGGVQAGQPAHRDP